MPKNLETAPTLIPVMTAPLSSAVGSTAKELPRKQAKSSRFPSIAGEVGATFQRRTWKGFIYRGWVPFGNLNPISNY